MNKICLSVAVVILVWLHPIFAVTTYSDILSDSFSMYRHGTTERNVLILQNRTVLQSKMCNDASYFNNNSIDSTLVHGDFNIWICNGNTLGNFKINRDLISFSEYRTVLYPQDPNYVSAESLDPTGLRFSIRSSADNELSFYNHQASAHSILFKYEQTKKSVFMGSKTDLHTFSGTDLSNNQLKPSAFNNPLTDSNIASTSPSQLAMAVNSAIVEGTVKSFDSDTSKFESAEIVVSQYKNNVGNLPCSSSTSNGPGIITLKFVYDHDSSSLAKHKIEMHLKCYGSIQSGSPLENGIKFSMQTKYYDATAQMWLSRLGDNTKAKSFVIDHPQKSDRYLVHSMVEGPHNTVFYRGKDTLKNGRAVVTLPDYFESLTRQESRVVFVTNSSSFDSVFIETQDGLQVKNGQFVVRSDQVSEDISFDWEVIAERKDIKKVVVEPSTSDYTRVGVGPYTYLMRQN